MERRRVKELSSLYKSKTQGRYSVSDGTFIQSDSVGLRIVWEFKGGEKPVLLHPAGCARVS